MKPKTKVKGDGKLAKRKRKRKKNRISDSSADVLRAISPPSDAGGKEKQLDNRDDKPLVVSKEEIATIREVNRAVVASRAQHSFVRQAFLSREAALLKEIEEKAEELKTRTERACRNLVGDRLDSEEWGLDILKGTVVRIQTK